MHSRWSDDDAQAIIDAYAPRGVCRELALRVYTSRLLGRDRRLVLHGGGNTSVKTTARDLTGETIPVIHVKGSGWDMADIEPEGLPAVRLEPLRRLLGLDTLDDEAMVNAQRGNLLDSASPTPSVETLLHAFLPHAYVDHTHANAVLALTDQPEGERLCREVYGDRAVVLPYIPPGFELAKAAHRGWEGAPDCEGLVLLKHGIFSFGASAREAYERMIDLVSLAEARLRAGRRPVAASTPPDALPIPVARLAPILRGLATRCAGSPRPDRFIVSHRSDADILRFVNGPDLARYGRAGVVTPDHAIRIKPWPCVLPAPRLEDVDRFVTAARAAMQDYVRDYRAYFERHDRTLPGTRTPLDPVPRVLMVPEVGLFALGRTAAAAAVAGDLAEAAIEVISDAEAVGRFESIGEPETFAMEYWSLEQAKLGRHAPKPLAGQVALITGAAGTIGLATARAFAGAGAEVAMLDRDESVERAAEEIEALGLRCDVTLPDQVAASIDRVCVAYGGVDVVISNAGAAWQGRIGEVDDAVLRRSFELNFFAHQNVARLAVARMLEQGTGGCLLFNVSKQAVNPGPAFGPYGLPKAATLALMRQYAIDYGDEGIRSSAVNADRIRGGMLTGEMVAARAKARGVSEQEYLSGNLLGREVTADDVAAAFLSLASAEATTGAVLTVDGGNIAAAMR